MDTNQVRGDGHDVQTVRTSEAICCVENLMKRVQRTEPKQEQKSVFFIYRQRLKDIAEN